MSKWMEEQEKKSLIKYFMSMPRFLLIWPREPLTHGSPTPAHRFLVLQVCAPLQDTPEEHAQVCAPHAWVWYTHRNQRKTPAVSPHVHLSDPGSLLFAAECAELAKLKLPGTLLAWPGLPSHHKGLDITNVHHCAGLSEFYHCEPRASWLRFIHWTDSPDLEGVFFFQDRLNAVNNLVLMFYLL